jgi:hypothetical protein
MPPEVRTVKRSSIVEGHKWETLRKLGGRGGGGWADVLRLAKDADASPMILGPVWMHLQMAICAAAKRSLINFGKIAYCRGLQYYLKALFSAFPSIYIVIYEIFLEEWPFLNT